MPFPALVLTAALTTAMPAAATTAHVRNWEAAAKETKSIYADVARTRENRPLTKTNESHGSVLIERPNRGRLRLEAKPPVGVVPNASDFESCIWTGNNTYYYDGLVKSVTEFGFVVGREKPKTPEDWLAIWFARAAVMPLALQLLGGSIPASGLNDRFVTRLLKTDVNYVYLELTPRAPADRPEFDLIIAVLHGPKVSAPGIPYTLRTVVIRKNNGQEEETWDFTNLKVDPPVPAGSFEYVPPPSGWKVHRPVRPKP
jgi:TIGR03009 family protein